jgi:hypothetical protein
MKPQPRKLIDLRKATEPDDATTTFICEYCDVKLIPYFDIKHEFITSGKLYQCGRCGQIKDTTARYDMKRQEELTTKGDNNNVFVTHLRQSPNPRKPKFDIDKGDDLMYKGMGMHIVRTRITVGGKIVRDDREQ